jgi:hypothetical protein
LAELANERRPDGGEGPPFRRAVGGRRLKPIALRKRTATNKGNSGRSLSKTNRGIS